MGRMIGSGISASCLPYSHKIINIGNIKIDDIKTAVIKFAK